MTELSADMNLGPAAPETRARLTKQIDKHTVYIVAERIDITTYSLWRCLAGGPLQRRTKMKILQGLDMLEQEEGR